MTQAQPTSTIKVGVQLAGDPGDLAEWLRDAAAFDAAGAEALWVDLASQSELDPLAMAAALAAVTFRVHLFVRLPAPDVSSPAFRRVLSTVDRVSRGRVRIVVDSDSVPGDAMSGVSVLRHVPGDPDAPGDPEVPGRPATLDDGNEHRWTIGRQFGGRAGWETARLAAAERGDHGLIFPASPSLLDLLRNPDDLGDRRDLQIAVG